MAHTAMISYDDEDRTLQHAIFFDCPYDLADRLIYASYGVIVFLCTVSVFMPCLIYIVEVYEKEFRFAHFDDCGYAGICHTLEYGTLADGANSVFYQPAEAPPLHDAGDLRVLVIFAQYPEDGREYMTFFATAIGYVFDLLTLPVIAPYAVNRWRYAIYDRGPIGRAAGGHLRFALIGPATVCYEAVDIRCGRLDDAIRTATVYTKDDDMLDLLAV